MLISSETTLMDTPRIPFNQIGAPPNVVQSREHIKWMITSEMTEMMEFADKIIKPVVENTNMMKSHLKKKPSGNSTDEKYNF